MGTSKKQQRKHRRRSSARSSVLPLGTISRGKLACTDEDLGSPEWVKLRYTTYVSSPSPGREKLERWQDACARGPLWMPPDILVFPFTTPVRMPPRETLREVTASGLTPATAQQARRMVRIR